MTYDNIKAYQQITAESAQYSDPYTLVGMLMENFIKRVTRSKAHLDNRDYLAKGKELDRALAILHALQGSLDFEQGGELAANLEALYDYMQRQTLLASARKDKDILDEMARLMRQIKDGWDGIAPQVQAGNVTGDDGQTADGSSNPGQSRISVTG